MTRRAASAGLAAALALVLGCGKKGPPQPIIRIVPSTPGALSVRQIGSEVVLASTLPGTRTDGTKLNADAELKVLRMPATESLRPGSVSDRYLILQFDKMAKPVATFSGAALEPFVLDGRFLYVDKDATAPVQPGATPASHPTPPGPAPTTPGAASSAKLPSYLYGLQVVEPKGRKSMLRSPSLMAVCAPPAAPVDLKLETAEGEVRLEWKPGAPPAPGAAPESGPLFDVYRKPHGQPREPEEPLNPAPLDSPAYIDRTFRYDQEYAYFVRGRTSDKTSLCESLSSPAVEVKPHDRFAPTPPIGLAVAAEGDVIRIYWFPSSEADLGGYRVYRREEGAAEATLLGEVPAAETSFIDSGAKRGVRYHYSVSAVDTASPVNESQRSEERSEILSEAPAEKAPGEKPGGAPPGRQRGTW